MSEESQVVLKEIGDKKFPIPTNETERFMAMVWSIAGMSGVDRIPSVLKKIDELNDAVNEHLSGKSIASGRLDINSQRKRFIAIFKTKYLEYTGHEYPTTITGTDSKIIQSVVEKVLNNGYCVDTYLKWLFDEYAPANKGFNPAVMKMVCMSSTVAKFLIDNKGCVDHKRLQMMNAEREADLRIRCKEILHGSFNFEVEEVELFKANMKKYSEGRITMDELEKEIVEMEKKAKSKENSNV